MTATTGDRMTRRRAEEMERRLDAFEARLDERMAAVERNHVALLRALVGAGLRGLLNGSKTTPEKESDADNP